MRRFIALIALPLSLQALDTEPWFRELFEFELSAAYTYSNYTRVQHSVHPLKHPSNDQDLLFGLSLPFSESMSADIELEFAETPRQVMNVRSGAIQARYLWLDDILGDPVSLTTGVVMRGVPSHALNDISCPYHNNFNFEINSAVGKEWAQGRFWQMHAYGVVALGIANRGAPWTRVNLTFQYNMRDIHNFEVFTNGYWGFGTRKDVNIKHFNSYAHIAHQSLDLGVGYRYDMNYWGALSFEYAYRLYALSFPQGVNFVTLRYQFPFSFF